MAGGLGVGAAAGAIARRENGRSHDVRRRNLIGRRRRTRPTGTTSLICLGKAFATRPEQGKADVAHNTKREARRWMCGSIVRSGQLRSLEDGQTEMRLQLQIVVNTLELVLGKVRH